MIHLESGGGGGATPKAGGPATLAMLAAPGPKRICLCCCFCISSMLDLSISKMTGASITTEDEKTTQAALLDHAYKDWTLEDVFTTDFVTPDRNQLGNISNKPVILS